MTALLHTGLAVIDVSGVKVVEEEMIADESFELMNMAAGDKDLMAVGRMGELIAMNHLMKLKEQPGSQIEEVGGISFF